MLPLLLLGGCILGKAAFNLRAEREDQYLHDDSVKSLGGRSLPKAYVMAGFSG